MKLKSILVLCIISCSIVPSMGQDCDLREWSGTIKYHEVTNAITACGFNPMVNDTMYAALRSSDYDSERLCNTCIKIVSGEKSVVLKIMDKSGTHGLDIHKKAFAKLGDTTLGNIEATWSIVSCPVTGSIGYRYTADSYTEEKKIEIVNSCNGIRKLFFKKVGTVEFKEIFRSAGNPNDFFVMTFSDDVSSGPFDFMVEDIYGNVVTDFDIPFSSDKTFYGDSQMPFCNTISSTMSEDLSKLKLVLQEKGIILLSNFDQQTEIIVYDISGKTRMQKTLNTNTFLDLSSKLSTGFYLLSFESQIVKFMLY